jgi:hypothetical protein
MACFLAPVAEALVTTIIEKRFEKKSYKNEEIKVRNLEVAHNLKTLNIMLWGGSALLLLEHIYHGEVTLFFPFFTAMKNAQDFQEMLLEIATRGVVMALAVTSIWGLFYLVKYLVNKKNKKKVLD